MSAEDLPCREVTEILDGYLDGTMPADDRARLDAHLRICEGCVNYLDQLRTTIRLTGTLSDRSLPPGTTAAVMDAFRAWKAR
jgi:anti-sigma factor RsiW